MNQEIDKKNKQKIFYVDTFRPEDADSIVRLFRSVYGESYPIRLFYDPEAIIAANREGRYYSIVARTPAGEVIGVNHLFNSAPYKGLYESGAGLVLKEYRGSGALTATLDYICNRFVPRNPHIQEAFGQPVCNHVFSQREVVPMRYIEMGIEVALMPAEAYSHEKSAHGRVATLDIFRCYVPKPHRIFVPRPYEEVLRGLYNRLDDERDIVQSDGSLPDAVATETGMTIFDFAQVARIAVPQAGGDFAACVAGLEEQARAKRAIVFQVWLNLAEPWIGEAVDILRARGYFFGGALPRWFDNDGLLMQKLECPPDFDKIVLLSDSSKELLKYIREDRERHA